LISIGSQDTNPAQHVLCGPEDPKTTINFNHLDVSRDGGVDEQEIHWLFAKLMEDCDSKGYTNKAHFSTHLSNKSNRA
jgi:hypothetical protein